MLVLFGMALYALAALNHSADVIHAFWVPLLAGKTQMIPGQSNRQWIETDQAGEYQGDLQPVLRCPARAYGFPHHRRKPGRFAKWVNSQRKPDPVQAAGQVGQGERVFSSQCSGCHEVRGTSAGGEHAPDLTHLMSRGTIAAGLLPNSPDQLMNWITHVQELKPGARMPDFSFSPADAAALSAYLATLK